MLVYEIYRDTLRKYHNDIDAIIAAGLYIPRDDQFVKNAYAFGYGTIEDFKKDIERNRIYCRWYDPAEKRFI